MPANLDPRFQEAVEAFNRQEFFECHEILEELWKVLPEGDEKLFYQGLLQVAVGFHHWQQGNLAGALSLLSRGLAKLESLQPQQAFLAWICLEHLITATQQYFAGLQALAPPEYFPKIETP